MKPEILMEKTKEIIKILATEVVDCVCDEDESVTNAFDEAAADYIFSNAIKDNDTLLAISKASTYFNYASDDLIAALRGNKEFDPVFIVLQAIDRKAEEEAIDPADEAEVERLINETEDIIEEVEIEAEDVVEELEETKDSE